MARTAHDSDSCQVKCFLAGDFDTGMLIWGHMPNLVSCLDDNRINLLSLEVLDCKEGVR